MEVAPAPRPRQTRVAPAWAADATAQGASRAHQWTGRARPECASCRPLPTRLRRQPPRLQYAKAAARVVRCVRPDGGPQRAVRVAVVPILGSPEQQLPGGALLHDVLVSGAGAKFFFFFFFCKDKSAQYKGHPGGRMRPNLSTYIPDRRNPENCLVT